MNDDDETRGTTRERRTGGSMSILRELDIGLNLEEFTGLDDDAADDLQNDLFGDDNLTDDEDDDENPENDDVDDGDFEQTARRSTAVGRKRIATDERVARMQAEEQTERDLGFTQPVRRRIINLRQQMPYDWWLSSARSYAMFNEDSHGDELVLRKIDQSLTSTPPATSLGRVFDMPKRIEDIVFEPWVAFTTTEVTDTNSVATFYTGLLPNLTDVAHRAIVFCFNLRRFAACKTTMHDGTVLLFCGSAVCTGPKGPAQSNAQCQRYVLWLNQLGVPATMQGFRLQNLVSKASAGWEVDLNAIHTKYPLNAQYKPIRFPGVIFRLEFEYDVPVIVNSFAEETQKREDQIVAIFFKSGKTIITGSKTRAKTRIVWTFLQNRVLREFKKREGGGHVTEAAYRRSVAEESTIISATCQKIHQLAAERVQFDMLLDRQPAATTSSFFVSASESRKRRFADAIGESLIDNNDDNILQPSPISRFIDSHLAQQRAAPDIYVANWLANNSTLIKT